MLKAKIKEYLKQADKTEIKKLIKNSDLTELEYWVLYFNYVENRMVENTCMKLHISEKQFFIILREALTKLYYIKDLQNCTL